MGSLPKSVKQVDVVEISPAVIQALPYFQKVHHNIESNPKVTTYIEDAKTYLQLNRETYDIIINEPSNPWVTGIGNLFSIEYYQQVNRSLSKDGMFMQWVQVYETSDAIIVSVLHTLRAVFPHVDMWYSGSSDILLTCYKKRNYMDKLGECRRQFDEIKEYVRDSRIENFEEILLRHMADEKIIDSVLHVSKPILNSIEFPFIEYEAPKQLFIDSNVSLPDYMDQRSKPRKRSTYPFLAVFEGREPADFFAYFKNFHKRTKLSYRLRTLEVIYNKLWFYNSPWSQKYVLDELPNNYRNADTKERKFWFLKSLFDDYTNLRNCFVDVPFVPFLREKFEKYLSEFPDDQQISLMHAELVNTEFGKVEALP